MSDLIMTPWYRRQLEVLVFPDGLFERTQPRIVSPFKPALHQCLAVGVSRQAFCAELACSFQESGQGFHLDFE